MHFESFVGGPLLWITFSAFVVAVLARIIFFLCSIIQSSKSQQSTIRYLTLTFGRFLLPFHKGVMKKPGYSVLRYVFHIWLVAVPIWTSGHIVMLSASRFGWYWDPLPDVWTDLMTLFVLGLSVFLLVRHIVVPNVRLNTSGSDYLLIAAATLPFLTGFITYHQWFDYKTVRTLHMLSGEAVLVVVAFLFCRTLLDVEKCTGCAACVLSCPTGTLEAIDRGKQRFFEYGHYQCISCAECLNTCPDEAAKLIHEISLKRFFQIFTKQKLLSVPLIACRKCSALFAAEPQLHREGRDADFEDYLSFCPRCRRTIRADIVYEKSMRR